MYENALKTIDASAQKKAIDTQWQRLFAYYPSLTAREFSELSDIPRQDSEAYLQGLTEQGHLSRIRTKNGDLWLRKQTGEAV